jgi:hypothetical protein
MKKISFLFIVLAFNFASAERRIFHAPFATVTTESEFVVKARLQSPELVPDEVFKSAVVEDCRDFSETVKRYGAMLTEAQLLDLVTSSLGSGMKKQFEVTVEIDAETRLNLGNQQGELSLIFNEQEPKVELTGKDLFPGKLQNTVQLEVRKSARTIHLIFLRRDTFCRFLKQDLSVDVSFNGSWKTSTSENERSERNLEMLAQDIQSSEQLSANSKERAALLGLKLARTLQDSRFSIARDLASVDYIWDLLFENENSMQKSTVWTDILSGAGFSQEPIEVQVKGLL